MQEIRLCFLAEVEKCGEETARAHRRTLNHSLYEAIWKAQPFKESYDHFRRREYPHVIPWESVRAIIGRDDVSDEIISKILFRQAITALSEADKQMLLWRLEGATQREIARRIGLNESQISRKMKRIRAEIMRVQ